MRSLRRLTAILIFFLAPWAWSRFTPRSSSFLTEEGIIASVKLRENLSPKDGRAGAVLASPQRKDPNYYYHWTRDAALTMDVVLTQLESAPSAADARRLADYLAFSRFTQNSGALGEPKFDVDGTPFTGPWARPQNDGPALRAITFMHYARFLRAKKQDAAAAWKVATTDLNYVAKHWADPSFDLWEEVEGDHFYTRMVQRKAMLQGAALAKELGDATAPAYAREAKAIDASLDQFWDAAAGFIQVTRRRSRGLNYKTSGLDTAILLGALHGGMGDGRFDAGDARVEKTLDRLDAAFKKLYKINGAGEGVALGRYPEDKYAGADFGGGNPWFLTTLAAAEFEFRRAALCHEGASANFARAESYVARVASSRGPGGSLSEQFNRDTGALTSARDLTWSFAAALTAREARRAALRACPKVATR